MNDEKRRNSSPHRELFNQTATCLAFGLDRLVNESLRTTLMLQCTNALLPCRIGASKIDRLPIFKPRTQEQQTLDANEKSKNMNIIRNYRNWRNYRQTVNELSRLTNRELADLGINRADIPYVARKAA